MANKKICTCAVCGTEFNGYTTSRYCSDCREVVKREIRQRAAAKFRAAEAQAKAKAAAKKREEEERRRKETFVPNTEQCEKGCHYWQHMSGFGCNACHYRFDKEKGIKKDADGKCLCYTPKTEKNRKPWEMPAATGATLAGYKT